MNDFIYFAHRGASGYEPENTLIAIRKALKMGAKWIEIDVYGVENELVVIHDERLERTTNGKGLVTNSSLEYLRSLDAGKGEKIPLLREVFETIGHSAGLNIELKASETAELAVSYINEFVGEYGWEYSRILVSSFEHHELQRVKKLQPEILLAPIFSTIPKDYITIAKEIDAFSVNLDAGFLKKQYVEDIHNQMMKVFVYTLNDKKDIQFMKEIGVDGVFTNYPDLIELPE
jgi:glycerophosphoryl diester phosphodiesterase